MFNWLDGLHTILKFVCDYASIGNDKGKVDWLDKGQLNKLTMMNKIWISIRMSDLTPIRVNPNCPTGLQDRAFLSPRHLSIGRGKNDFITSMQEDTNCWGSVRRKTYMISTLALPFASSLGARRNAEVEDPRLQTSNNMEIDVASLGAMQTCKQAIECASRRN